MKAALARRGSAQHLAGPRRPSQVDPLPAAARHPKSHHRGVVTGILVYVGLTIAAYLLGKSLPVSPRARPLPTSSRTICKAPPAPFDPARAAGKTALITGAAGFIGSHVARCGRFCAACVA